MLSSGYFKAQIRNFPQNISVINYSIDNRSLSNDDTKYRNIKRRRMDMTNNLIKSESINETDKEEDSPS
jgi:hypothetical protein